MAETILSKDINGDQLLAELQAAGLRVDYPRAVIVGGVLRVEGNMTDQQLAVVVDAHDPNPDFGKPADEIAARDDIAANLGALESDLSQAVWVTLDTAAKVAVLRRSAQLTVRLARFVARRFLDG